MASIIPVIIETDSFVTVCDRTGKNKIPFITTLAFSIFFGSETEWNNFVSDVLNADMNFTRNKSPSNSEPEFSLSSDELEFAPRESAEDV